MIKTQNLYRNRSNFPLNCRKSIAEAAFQSDSGHIIYKNAPVTNQRNSTHIIRAEEGVGQKQGLWQAERNTVHSKGQNRYYLIGQTYKYSRQKFKQVKRHRTKSTTGISYRQVGCEAGRSSSYNLEN